MTVALVLWILEAVVALRSCRKDVELYGSILWTTRNHDMSFVRYLTLRRLRCTPRFAQMQPMYYIGWVDQGDSSSEVRESWLT